MEIASPGRRDANVELETPVARIVKVSRSGRDGSPLIEIGISPAPGRR
jgi:hypothetical protein